MRQEFYTLIEKLNSDPLCAVSVYDIDKFSQILKPTLGSDLKQEYGSIKDFVENLNSNNHKNLLVQEYRKNGSSFAKKGNAFPVNFGEKPVEQNQNFNQGLNGLAGFGLGFPDIMRLNTDSVLKATLEVKNEALEKENKELKSDNEKLKEQILKDQYDVSKKSNTAETAKNIVKEIVPLIGMFMKGGDASVSSLNAPTPQNLSTEKQQLISIISSPEFSNEMTVFMFQVLNNINTSETFYEEVVKLLQQ